jgi:hypothetical protein
MRRKKLRRMRLLIDRDSDAGQVTILVVLALSIFMIGFVGVATDYTNFWYRRQKAQGAADAACQSSAVDLLLYAGAQSTGSAGFDPSGGTFLCSAQPSATPCLIAKYNGYDGAASGKTVQVSFPASVPGYTAPQGVDYSYVQVDVTEQVATTFSKLITGKSNVAVHASASCGLTSISGPAPLIVLHPTKAGSLSMNGNPSIIISGGPTKSVQINSSSANAIIAVGAKASVDISKGGPNYTGGDFAVFGGPSSPIAQVVLGSGHWRYPSLPILDPYRLVSAPSVPAVGAKSSVSFRTNGCPDSGGCDEYTAGSYSSGITVKNATAIFDPGVYYVTGGLSFLANSNVRVSTATGDGSGGVMFYFSGNSDPVTVWANSGKGTTVPYHLDGSTDNGVASRALQCPGGAANPSGLPGTVDGNVLLGPCTGPYADPSGKFRGFVFFQDRSVALNAGWGGGGTSLLSGLMYFHQCASSDANKQSGLHCSVSTGYGTTTTLQGGSGTGAYTMGALVSDQVSLGGNSQLFMYLSPYSSFGQIKAGFLK